MKYRFLGQSGECFPNLKHGRIYKLMVITAFWSKKPHIVKPFWCPYENWRDFYKNWRPMTISIMRLEKGLDKRTKID